MLVNLPASLSIDPLSKTATSNCNPCTGRKTRSHGVLPGSQLPATWLSGGRALRRGIPGGGRIPANQEPVTPLFFLQIAPDEATLENTPVHQVQGTQQIDDAVDGDLVQVPALPCIIFPIS